MDGVDASIVSCLLKSAFSRSASNNVTRLSSRCGLFVREQRGFGLNRHRDARSSQDISERRHLRRRSGDRGRGRFGRRVHGEAWEADGEPLDAIGDRLDRHLQAGRGCPLHCRDPVEDPHARRERHQVHAQRRDVVEVVDRSPPDRVGRLQRSGRTHPDGRAPMPGARVPRILPRLGQRLRRQTPARRAGRRVAGDVRSQQRLELSHRRRAQRRGVLDCPGAVRADGDKDVRREASREAHRCGQHQDCLQHSSLLSGIGYTVKPIPNPNPNPNLESRIRFDKIQRFKDE